MKEGGRDRGVPEMPAEGLRNAIAAAQRYLLSIQRPDGHWCGELEGDTILESEYILTLHFLGRTGETRVKKAAEYLRRKQLPGGGWPNYEGGPADVSVSVKAYFALKLAGDDRDAPHMVAGARGDPATRRHRGDELVHANLSLGLRPVGLERLSGRAAGARASARLVPVHHLQDLVVVANDRRAARDHLGDEAVLRGARRAPRSRSSAPASCPSAARRTR